MSKIVISKEFNKNIENLIQPILDGLYITIDGTIRDTVEDIEETRYSIPLVKTYAGAWRYKSLLFSWDFDNVESSILSQVSGPMNNRTIVVPELTTYTLNNFNKQNRKDRYISGIVKRIYDDIGNTDNSPIFKKIEEAISNLMSVVVGDTAILQIYYVYIIDCTDSPDEVRINVPAYGEVLIAFNTPIEVPEDATVITYNNLADYPAMYYNNDGPNWSHRLATVHGERKAVHRFNDYNYAKSIVTILDEGARQLRLLGGEFYGVLVGDKV